MAIITTWSRVEVAERMTAAEFWQEAPEDHKAELINGVLIMAPPPLDIHERLQLFLVTLLRSFAEEHDLGEVRGSRTAVELGPDQVYEPDILFVERARSGLIGRKGVVGPPDLVIEILSASTAVYDRGEKLRGYEQAGVRELWLIDPYGPAGTEFYQLTDGHYSPFLPDSAGLIRSVAMVGLVLDAHWLWPNDRFISVRQALLAIEGMRSPKS